MSDGEGNIMQAAGEVVDEFDLLQISFSFKM